RAIGAAPEVLREYTSVTKRLRRVARFDLDAVKVACDYNRPTSLALMGLDRLDYANTGLTDITSLTPEARDFVERIELATGVRVEFYGTGFGTFDAASTDSSSRIP